MLLICLDWGKVSKAANATNALNFSSLSTAPRKLQILQILKILQMGFKANCDFIISPNASNAAQFQVLQKLQIHLRLTYLTIQKYSQYSKYLELFKCFKSIECYKFWNFLIYPKLSYWKVRKSLRTLLIFLWGVRCLHIIVILGSTGIFLFLILVTFDLVWFYPSWFLLIWENLTLLGKE